MRKEGLNIFRQVEVLFNCLIDLEINIQAYLIVKFIHIHRGEEMLESFEEKNPHTHTMSLA